MTLHQVAEKMGVSHVAVLKMERTGNPKITSLQRYADAVGVPVEEIVKDLVNGLVLA